MATVEKSINALKAFRNIASTLRKADKNFKTSDQYKYLIEQMRDNQITTRKYARSPKEAEGVANLYLSYLQSTERLNELQAKYKGGEKTVEESARLVGLKLPETKKF